MIAYAANLATIVAIFGILAATLNFVVGFAGIFSVAHAVFFGLGAYAGAQVALHLVPDALLACIVAAVVAGGLSLCLALPARRFAHDLAVALERDSLGPGEAFDADRRLAGIFLREHAAPGEVVNAPFGWVAFESRLPANDLTGLNSHTFRTPAAYSVVHGVPWNEGFAAPSAPPDMIPLATFNLASDLAPGWSWFTVSC